MFHKWVIVVRNQTVIFSLELQVDGLRVVATILWFSVLLRDFSSMFLPWRARMNGSWKRFLSVWMCHLVKNPFDCVEHVTSLKKPPF